MKYGYDGVSNDQLIKNYKISDNKIVITFLDNSNYEIALTKENENNLLNTMLEQAQDRDQSSILINLQMKKKKHLIIAIVDAVCTLFNAININTYSDSYAKIWYEFLFCMTLLCTIVNSAIYKDYDQIISELKKYNIYLSIREELEKNINEPNLFNGVKNQQEGLNINTLDNYSLNDLIVIQKNLKRIKEFSSYLIDSPDTPQSEDQIGFQIIK